MKLTIDVQPIDMLVFAAVARDGSFTAAAQSLGMTKQSVSARVARLEQALRVRLLERTTRQLRLTDTGASYVQQCQAIAAAIQEANASVQQRQAEPTGTLRIASPSLFGRRFLAPILAQYATRFPRVEIDLTLVDRAVDLIADGFDLAIQIGALPDSSARVRRLGDGHLYFVASPSYLASEGMPAPMDLPRRRCVGFRESEEWRINDTRMRIRPVMRVNDLETLCELAVAGVGIGRLPGLVCREALTRGQLVRLFPDARVSVRPISVVFPSKMFLPRAVEEFVQLLVTMSAPQFPL